MRLKTYIVNNVTEAIPMIKQDLGSDAMILNTKKVKKGGFLGLFQTEKLEVVAAVESKSANKKIEEPKSVVLNKEPSIPLDVKPDLPPNSYKEKEIITDNLISELKSIKTFMLSVIEEERMPETLKTLKKQLEEQEVSKEVQSEIFAELLAALEQNPGLTVKQIKKVAHQEIVRLIKSHQKEANKKSPNIICFVGPTGVGKTTTIAKIAADYMLKEDKKVGLITSDTFRIAAVEQLRTYASILNIPIKVVETSEDIVEAMSNLSECDIVLMDTAGRNYQQKQYIADLESLLPEKDNIQISLVLSLTSKYDDMKKIIENFKTIKMDQLVITKHDETSTSGAILNLIYRYSLPLRYIANGQNVPDDILEATPELIADFVLGEEIYG